MNNPLITIAFPAHEILKEGETILAADVGGTKTDLALCTFQEGVFKIIKESVFPSKQYGSFTEIVRHFDGHAPLPQRLSIAFAGPIVKGRAVATNLDWVIDQEQVSRELQIPQVFLINDLEAEAYGLAALQHHDFMALHTGKSAERGNIGILAPGTGLGEAGLFWDGKALHPFATEGGHVDFAPRTRFDWKLLRYLQKQFGHVSWERVLSGPGIYQIYCFLRDIEHRDEPAWLKAQIQTMDPSAAIGLGAQQGIPVCEETLRLFVRYLSMEAANLALKLMATGGIFLGGGILPKIWNQQLEEVFLEHFFEVGRLRPVLENIPVYLVLNPKTVLFGAAYYAR